MAEAKKATPKAAAAAAAEAIKNIEAVEKEDSGIPEDKSLDDLVADKMISVLTEKRTDYTDGSIQQDWSFIPEHITLLDGSKRHVTRTVKLFGEKRTMTLDGEYFVRWCHPGRFDRHRRQGYDFVRYDDLFKDADYFQRTPDNRIRNGDVYLMKIKVDGYARMLREKLELRKTYERYHEGEITNEAEKFNTKAVRIAPDGTTENIN